jgi:hypothetical protein
MVYTALQFITRGREQGISVVDLGKKTRYDQKTCFYLVKQLMDLNLMQAFLNSYGVIILSYFTSSVKLKKSGVGSNFVIHKYFYERDLSWQQIRNEEARADGTPEVELQRPDGPETKEGDSKVAISFDPIDTRHLSSLPLVRGRIVKLLKASQNNMHSSTNLLVALVCVTCFHWLMVLCLLSTLGFPQSHKDRSSFLSNSSTRPCWSWCD